MRTNKATWLLIGCFILTVLSGVLRGRIDQRWGVSEVMREAAKRMHQMPTSIGNWALESDDGTFQELSEPTVKMLRCHANLVATYKHRHTHQRVNLVFMVGPAGPLAQHTPEVCYGSSNFELAEKGKQTQIEDSEGQRHEFSVIGFEENHSGGRPIRVYYSWNRQGVWVAPASPRTAFAGLPMLYKLQVSTPREGDDPELQDAAELFLRDCLPTLKAICN